MLYFIRHGETDLNTGTQGQGEGSVRGWSRVPLNKKGVDQAYGAGRKIVHLLAGRRPASFASSDLPRAAQTAHIVGQHLFVAPTFDQRLRTFHSGTLTGKPIGEVKPAVKNLVENHAQSAPGGESIQQFADRFTNATRAKVESPEPHVVVGHGQDAAILEAIASPVGGIGKHINKAHLMKSPTVKPGGVMVVHPDWHTEVHNPDEQVGAAGPSAVLHLGQSTQAELKHPIYAPASEGPFRCDNCEYFVAPTTCKHPEIIKLRKGVVEAAACCDYFETKGKGTR